MVITYIFSKRLEDQIRVQLRCRNLADAINRTGYHSANLLDINSFAKNTPESRRVCAGSDILVIYRYLYGPILAMVQYWKARDKKVIVDLDQAVNHLTGGLPDHPFWFRGLPLEAHPDGGAELIDPAPFEQFKWGLGMVDAATAASDRLADDWSKFTAIHKVPDYINIYQYPGLPRFHGDEIWLGLRNDANFAAIKNSGLSDALAHACRKHPQLRLAWFNPAPHSADELEIDPGQLLISSPHFFDEWVNTLLGVDIGIAPVCGEYDLRMGAGGLLEFMISKIPWIASEQLPLRELVPYGQCVLNTTDAWEGAILTAVDQLGLYRKKAAKEQFLYAISQDASANIDRVLKVYSSIINRNEKV